MKRSPLVRKTGLTSRTPLVRGAFAPRKKPMVRGAQLARTSAKKRQQDRERTAMKRDLVENRGGMCEVRHWPIPGEEASGESETGQCFGMADDVHEPLTRARGGSITDPDNALLVCRGHHDLIHAHPAEAERRGYLKRRGPK